MMMAVMSRDQRHCAAAIAEEGAEIQPTAPALSRRGPGRLDRRGDQAYILAYAREIPMPSPRHVKLFKNGRNQAVRIPREFELPGEDAIMRMEDGKIIIEAAPPKSLLAVLSRLSPIDESFPPIDDPAPEPVDL